LAGKRVLIVGASAGIGRAVALRAAHQGARVANVTVGLFSSLLPNRSVGVETLVLRSPAPVTGSTESMDAAASANLGPK
jgi:NAD(P)-dependent dehydrogenase (short-subunit alcohol dehydrogenase family)